VLGDCIVIAGKGHEDYQEINGQTIPFSDSACVLNALKMRI
jgi:UDP-N-acetylmuramoyl-L-alanyl-D-glutamate--2,6-diaminopimelate ligase